jgi:nickel-dependent lactate racemase
MVIGKGYENKFLSEEEARKIIEDAVSKTELNNRKVLVLLPDSTRSGPADFFFRQFCETIGRRAGTLDFLITLGTHPVMKEEKVLEFLKISSEERKTRYGKFNIFNHRWDIPDTFKKIGAISPDEIYEISNGLFKEEVPVELNKLVLEYDLIIIYGPVFPHEAVGFSGGNKYFFPGIAGFRIINFFHWLGAVITNIKINGTKDTPVRKIVDKAASFIKVPALCFASVVSGDKLRGLFFGTAQEAWSHAADLSAKIHIVYKDKPFKRVLGIAPEMYDDIWTAGKVMYKLEPVVEDGGELVIYAPHISEISYTHGKVLDRIGYHVRDYFLKQMDKFKDIPRGNMAHSTNVKGIGSFENGVEKPRINVVLATGIPPERCKKVNLGYRNPSDINIQELEGKEQEGILVVHHAGEVLHKLRPS